MSLFSMVSLLISLAAISSYVNYRYIKLPTTVGVMLVALVASLALVLVGPYAGGFREQATAMISRIDFNQVVLHGMLAFLLFAGAIHVKLEDLGREWLTIFSLAIFGTLASTFIVGAATWLVLGESLFNDGLGVAVFLILLQLSGFVGAGGSGAGAPLSIGFGAVGILLLKEVGGALVLALAAGFITYRMLKRVDDYQIEVLLTLALAMGLYALADALHLSAPIAVVVAGLFMGNQGRALAMTGKTREHVDTFWELIDQILNVVLFLLIGLELLVLRIEPGWLLAGVLAIPIVMSARWVSVAGIIGPLGWVKAQSKGAIRVLTWGGLRGAISVAMALSLPANYSRSLVLTLTYFVVVFSILVQGLTVGRLIRMTSGPTAAPHVSPGL